MRGDAELEKLAPGAEGGGLLPLSEVDAQRKAALFPRHFEREREASCLIPCDGDLEYVRVFDAAIKELPQGTAHPPLFCLCTDDDVLNIGLGLMLRQKRVRDAGFPAILRANADRLGLVDTVDGPAPAETRVSAGHLVPATVIDTPGGRGPPYHLSDSFAGGDVESLLGADIRSEDLSDDAAGRAPGRVKGDAIVNSIFLEKEGRVEAPGLVLLAPLIWRLVELDSDRHIAGAGGTLDGWDKRRTRRPTAFVMRFKFAHVRVVRPGGSARLLDPLGEVQRGWPAAMNLGPSVFFGPKGAGRSP